MKRERPVSDCYRIDGVRHWPSIETESCGDAIIARLRNLSRVGIVAA